MLKIFHRNSPDHTMFIHMHFHKIDFCSCHQLQKHFYSKNFPIYSTHILPFLSPLVFCFLCIIIHFCDFYFVHAECWLPWSWLHVKDQPNSHWFCQRPEQKWVSIFSVFICTSYHIAKVWNFCQSYYPPLNIYFCTVCSIIIVMKKIFTNKSRWWKFLAVQYVSLLILIPFMHCW